MLDCFVVCDSETLIVFAVASVGSVSQLLLLACCCSSHLSAVGEGSALQVHLVFY